MYIYIYVCSGFGGLGVACWPLVSKFAGSNPAEAAAHIYIYIYIHTHTHTHNYYIVIIFYYDNE